MQWYDFLIIGFSVLLIISICVFLAIKIRNAEKKAIDDGYDPSLRNVLSTINGYLSDKEFNFYKILFSVAVKLGYIVFPKIEIRSIINCRDEELRRKNPLDTTVDFCLFKKHGFVPIMAIDLYDNTIGDSSLDEFDKFLVKILVNGGIPVLKVKASDSLGEAEVEKMVVTELENHKRKMTFKDESTKELIDDKEKYEGSINI